MGMMSPRLGYSTVSVAITVPCRNYLSVCGLAQFARRRPGEDGGRVEQIGRAARAVRSE